MPFVNNDGSINILDSETPETNTTTKIQFNGKLYFIGRPPYTTLLQLAQHLRVNVLDLYDVIRDPTRIIITPFTRQISRYDTRKKKPINLFRDFNIQRTTNKDYINNNKHITRRDGDNITQITPANTIPDGEKITSNIY